MHRIRKFIKDFLSSYFLTVCKLCLLFISIPIYLNLYGEELYGVYLLTFGIASSFALFDFGASYSMIKYSGKYKKDKDIVFYAEAIKYNMNAIIGIILITIPIAFFVSIVAPLLFKMPEAYIQEAKILILISPLYLAAIFFGNFYQFLLNGLDYFAKRNKFQYFTILMNGISLALVYFFSVNIYILCLLTVLPIILGICLDIFFIRKYEQEIFHLLRPKVNLSFAYLFKSKFSKFNGNLFKLTALNFFSREADKPIIGALIHSTALVTYSVLLKPFYILKGFNANLFFVVQPKLVKHQNNPELIKSIIANYSAINLIFLLFVCVLSVFLYPMFVTLWLGEYFQSVSALLVYLSLLNLFISGFYKCQYALLNLSNDNSKLLRVESIAISINVAFSVLFIQQLGVASVLIGTTIQAIILCLYFYFRSKKEYQFSLSQYFHPEIILIFILCTLGIYYFNQKPFFTVANWTEFILAAFGFGAFLLGLTFIPFRKRYLIIRKL